MARVTVDAAAKLQLENLDVTERIIAVLGDVAIARYVLVARGSYGSDSTFRVTDVLRHQPDRWHIVHSTPRNATTSKPHPQESRPSDE